jgi:hypothetical protein
MHFDEAKAKFQLQVQAAALSPGKLGQFLGEKTTPSRAHIILFLLAEICAFPERAFSIDSHHLIASSTGPIRAASNIRVQVRPSCRVAAFAPRDVCLQANSNAALGQGRKHF